MTTNMVLSAGISRIGRLTRFDDDVVFYETEAEENALENVVQTELVAEVEAGPHEARVDFHFEALAQFLENVFVWKLVRTNSEFSCRVI